MPSASLTTHGTTSKVRRRRDHERSVRRHAGWHDVRERPSRLPRMRSAGEVLDRFELDSTAGPVEHVKTRCVHRHGFLMPAELLTARAQLP